MNIRQVQLKRLVRLRVGSQPLTELSLSQLQLIRIKVSFNNRCINLIAVQAVCDLSCVWDTATSKRWRGWTYVSKFCVLSDFISAILQMFFSDNKNRV